MRLSQVGELALLDDIRRRFPRKARALRVGIGDDAAVIASDKRDLVATTDMMMEGVHFDLSYATPFQVGFKLISVNVSDIYAMGGMPHYALLNIAVKGNTKKSFIDEFLNGVKTACNLYKVSLVGGDLSSSLKEMALSATLLGYVKVPITRRGAKLGDRIYVTGSLGDSAMGLFLLKNRIKDLDAKTTSYLTNRHLMPLAKDPKAFKAYATSMIDISDGLLIDLMRLCKESGIGARLYEERIPISKELRTASEYLGYDPLKLALSGGEDYELVFTAPQRKRLNAICIGETVQSGLTIVDRHGKDRAIKPEGYCHFEV